MASIMFGTLSTIGVPADEKVVRNTATPVDVDAPPAMQDDMPEMGEVETDPNPNLGMSPRQMASKWFDRIRSRPGWIPQVSDGTNHNAIINEQVSSSGFAASKEAAGEWGHGTMPHAVGIEPVGDLRDGGKMGNEYFTAHKPEIQQTTDPAEGVQPPSNYDQGTTGRVAATGKTEARKAAMAGMYQTYWNGGN
jgi:hypothetical protein